MVSSVQIYMRINMKLFVVAFFLYLTFIPEPVNAATIKKQFTVMKTTIGFDVLVIAAYGKLRMNRSLESLPKL